MLKIVTLMAIIKVIRNALLTKLSHLKYNPYLQSHFRRFVRNYLPAISIVFLISSILLCSVCIALCIIRRDMLFAYKLHTCNTSSLLSVRFTPSCLR